MPVGATPTLTVRGQSDGRMECPSLCLNVCGNVYWNGVQECLCKKKKLYGKSAQRPPPPVHHEATPCSTRVSYHHILHQTDHQWNRNESSLCTTDTHENHQTGTSSTATARLHEPILGQGRIRTGTATTARLCYGHPAAHRPPAPYHQVTNPINVLIKGKFL